MARQGWGDVNLYLFGLVGPAVVSVRFKTGVLLTSIWHGQVCQQVGRPFPHLQCPYVFCFLPVCSVGLYASGRGWLSLVSVRLICNEPWEGVMHMQCRQLC